MSKAQPLIAITRRHAIIYAIFLVTYEFLTYISNDMIMPGMLQVARSFHAPDSVVARSLMLYMLGGSTLQIFLGPLSDHYGRRPVMITGAWVFLIFTILLACTGNIHQFLAGRFFQGMSLCFIVVVGYATIQEIFEEMEVVRLMAIMANVSISAPLLGPLAGAVFVSYWNWRWIFVVIAVLAAITLWGLWKFMPESVGQTKRDGEMIPRADLVLRDVGGRYMALLQNKKFMLASFAAGLLGLPCVAWIGLAPVIIVAASGDSLVNYGLWQMPVFGAVILGNITLHRLTHHFELKHMIMLGSSVVGAGLLLMLIFPLCIAHTFIWFMPGLIIYFFGLGLTGSPLARFTLFSTEITKGTASALMGLVLMSLQAVGIELVNHLYSSHNNLIFGAYCAGVGVVYIAMMGGIYIFSQKEKNRPAT
jgi:DHA1 family multidrug/chloramphenicol efflux transport protein-like MFS transporter